MAASEDRSSAECVASKKLHCILNTAKKASTPTTILLVGASGTGKSSLARSALHSIGFQIRCLDFRQLCHDDSTTTISAIIAAFQPAADGDATAVLLDDVDFWAPAPNSSDSVSPMDTRAIAALSDSLETAFELSQTFAFVATACNENAVHPALRYPGRLKHVLRLFPLSLAERASVAKIWLDPTVETNTGNEGEVEELAGHIAAMTPGFVHADFCRLFSYIDEQDKLRSPSSHSGKAGANGRGDHLRHTEFFHTFRFPEAIESIQPSLLTSSVGSSAYTRSITADFAPDSLYGLENAIERFRECITAVFLPQIQNPSFRTTELSANLRALRAIGTFRGLILHGATGCGKTAITRLAMSILPKNIVNFLHAEATSIVSSVIGDAERKLTRLFDVARAIAPALLVVENIDILAPSRDLGDGDGGSASEAFNRLLSTFLTQIDGVHWQEETSPIFIIATTRSLDLVDSALLRPGRFEIHIDVHPPDAISRVHILQSFLGSRGLQLREGMGKTMRFNFEEFRRRSEGWTAPDVVSFARELLMDEKFPDMSFRSVVR